MTLSLIQRGDRRRSRQRSGMAEAEAHQLVGICTLFHFALYCTTIAITKLIVAVLVRVLVFTPLEQCKQFFEAEMHIFEFSA